MSWCFKQILLKTKAEKKINSDDITKLKVEL